MSYTSIPLTVKDFDDVRRGICFGCGCNCGYIAYLKEKKIIDVYGDPLNPNNIGSLCSKGITLCQQIPYNPLRVKNPLLRRNGNEWEQVGKEQVIAWIKGNIKGRVGIFLDRFTDLIDYKVAKRITENIYSDAVYLPFRASSLSPQQWVNKKLILMFECEPVFSEVMATRWLVDAFEKGSYIVTVSSRYTTASSKAKKRILLKPPLVIRFLEDLTKVVRGEIVNNPLKEEIEKIAELLRFMEGSSLIVIGDVLLHSPWKNNVFKALKKLRSILKVDYSIVGDVSNQEIMELPRFLEDVEKLDSLIVFGNPAVYMNENLIQVLKEKPVLHFTLFPNLTSNCASLVVPTLLFQERDFFGYRSSFGSSFASKVIDPPENSFCLSDIFPLPHVEVPENSSLPFIEHWEENFSSASVEEKGVYLLFDRVLSEEIGHWSLWTHELSPQQEAIMNSKTAEKLGVKEILNIGDIKLSVKISSNIADDTVFIPFSFEETQPFGSGVRIGRLIKRKGYRIEKL